MQIVNGYACNCCADVSLARRGIDPENPTNDPVKAAEEARKSGRFDEAAVILDGALAKGALAGSNIAGDQASRRPDAGPGRIFDFKA